MVGRMSGIRHDRMPRLQSGIRGSVLDPFEHDPSFLDHVNLDLSILHSSILDPSILDPSVVDPSILDPSRFHPSFQPHCTGTQWSYTIASRDQQLTLMTPCISISCYHKGLERIPCLCLVFARIRAVPINGCRSPKFARHLRRRCSRHQFRIHL